MGNYDVLQIDLDGNGEKIAGVTVKGLITRKKITFFNIISAGHVLLVKLLEVNPIRGLRIS